MTQVIKHYCDICGKEFDKSDMPPWYPDYCPEHMEDYHKRENQLSAYTWNPKNGEKIRVWW